MWKPSQNPVITELTLTHRERVYRLKDLKPIRDGSAKKCIWCLTTLGESRYKWCSEECVANALAWARPQTAHGLRVLLERQDNSCAVCQLSWKDSLAEALAKVRRWSWVQPTKFTERYMRAFRRICSPQTRPEVDHIVGVAIGGQTLGFENVQLLCRVCHKAKTKIDVRTRIALNGSKLKGKPMSDAHKAAMSESRKGFDSDARKAHREKMYQDLRIEIVATNVKTGEELLFESMEACAKALNLQSSNISRVLTGAQNRKQHKGWKFTKR